MARVGLEEGAYLIGDESMTVSIQLRENRVTCSPPGGARGVLPATEACFKGEVILSLPFGAAAGEDW